MLKRLLLLWALVLSIVICANTPSADAGPRGTSVTLSLHAAIVRHAEIALPSVDAWEGATRVVTRSNATFTECAEFVAGSGSPTVLVTVILE